MFFCLTLLVLLLLNALRDLDLIGEAFPPKLLTIVEFNIPLRQLHLHLADRFLIGVVDTIVVLLFLLQQSRLTLAAQLYDLILR